MILFLMNILLFITDNDYQNLSNDNKQILIQITEHYFRPMKAQYIQRYLTGKVFIVENKYVFQIKKIYDVIKKSYPETQSSLFMLNPF